MTEDTIDAEQCAQLLRCTPEHVEDLARAGELPALKIGRGWVFIRADLLAYLAEKARKEAQDRRAKRHPSVTQLRPPAPRRRAATAPALPQPFRP